MMDQWSEEDVLDFDFAKLFGFVPLNVIEARHELRRSTDIFIAPRTAGEVRYFSMRETKVDDILRETEHANFTGIVKVSNSDLKSRGGVLLLRGRAVGAVRNELISPHTEPTEDSLIAMGADLGHESSLVMIYPVPEEVVIPMSSLFLGYPVERNDDYESLEYHDYIQDWLQSRAGTAALAFTQEKQTYLSFICQGGFVGFYEIDTARFDDYPQRVDKVLARYPSSSCEVCILPPELESASAFGFKLSSRWES